MPQEIASIKIFPEEQIQLLGKKTIGAKDYYLTDEGLNSLTSATSPQWGVARMGDHRPTAYRPDLKKADGSSDNVPNRIPRIPCQFVAIAFDNAGALINGGDVKNGLLYDGAKLPNGNHAILEWSATMANTKGTHSSVASDKRNPNVPFEETATGSAEPTPTKALGFAIDDTGLLIPGNDGLLHFKVTPPSPAGPDVIKSGDFGYTTDFLTDRSCEGFVKLDYAEKKTTGAKVNSLPQVKQRAIIAQPDWAVAKDTPKGWSLP